MSMHRMFLVTAVAALATSVSHAEKPSAIYELSAEGEIQIAPDGHVSDYRIRNHLPDQVVALISRKVHDWRFDPILVDGKAVVAKTAMSLKLSAEPAAGKADEFVVRVVSVDFGTPARMSGGRLPRFPDIAAQARLEAKVMLAARLDENGNVVEVVPYQTSLGARTRNEKEAERWRKVFERASVSAAKTWRYSITETVNGHPIGSRVFIPVVFGWGGSSSSNRWKGYVPGPIHPAPWDIPTDEKRIAQIGENETLSIGSSFHLQDDVVGKVL